jgi:protein BCP1
LINYFLEKSKSDKRFHETLSELLQGKNGDVGLVLSEKIVNMPPAVAGPNYKMLLEEIQWAIDDVHFQSRFPNSF